MDLGINDGANQDADCLFVSKECVQRDVLAANVQVMILPKIAQQDIALPSQRNLL